jgi:hypothetical protein
MDYKKYSHKEILIRIEAKNELRKQIKEKLPYRVPEIEELLKEV